jgi:hypothetical protein
MSPMEGQKMVKFRNGHFSFFVRFVHICEDMIRYAESLFKAEQVPYRMHFLRIVSFLRKP